MALLPLVKRLGALLVAAHCYDYFFGLFGIFLKTIATIRLLKVMHNPPIPQSTKSHEYAHWHRKLD